jgi:hypothetical protein
MAEAIVAVIRAIVVVLVIVTIEAVVLRIAYWL